MRKMCRYVSEMCGRKVACTHVFILNRILGHMSRRIGSECNLSPPFAMASAPSCAQKPIDWLGGVPDTQAAENITEQLRDLCGLWLDQKGSLYQLLPASEHSLHVYTTRPSGQRRYTAHLIRLVTKRGYTCIVWGSSYRYTLAHGDGGPIAWRGRNEGDIFDWTRIM